jgi:hypothetical protein
VNGYQAGGPNQPNPLDVCAYYLTKESTPDFSNFIVPLAPTSTAFAQSHYGNHSWNDGDSFQWAKDLAQTQSLSMQMLYDRWGHPILSEHPVYTNQQLANIMYVGMSLIIDTTQGDPHRVPDGIWYQLLHGGNVNGWAMVIQDNPALWVAGWPPSDYRSQGASPPGGGRGKKK